MDKIRYSLEKGFLSVEKVGNHLSRVLTVKRLSKNESKDFDASIKCYVTLLICDFGGL